MALIYADDFQQIKYTGFTMNGPGQVSYMAAKDGPRLNGIFESYGFAPPSGAGYSGNGLYPDVIFDLVQNALMIQRISATTYVGGEAGLLRTVTYAGDTVRFSFLIELHPVYKNSGPFLSFGTSMTPGNNEQGLYSIGVNASGFYTVNSVDTTTTAYYSPASAKIFHEVVFTPTTMEFWLGDTLIATQPRSNIPIKQFRVGFYNLAVVWVMWVHGIIVSDNSGTTMTGRIGRKRAVTYAAVAQGAIGSTVVATPAASTALAVIQRPATGKATDTDSTMLGSLVSPLGYITNAFTATKDSKVPYAAIANVQVKRRAPAGDGLAAFPYIKIGATKIRGTPPLSKSLWNLYNTEIPIGGGQVFTDFEFGFDQDFLDVDRVFISNRSGVEVYGNPTPGYALVGSPYTAKVPAIVKANIEPTQYTAYISDYAKSTLTLDMKVADNLTYSQDQ